MSFFEPIASASVLKRRRTRLVLRAALLSLALCACMPSQARGLFGNDAKDRQAKAHAMWQERCKKAGVFIHRTVDDVEGIYLLKPRPEKPNFSDQYRMDDPFTGSDVFISVLLMGRDKKGSIVRDNVIAKGYSYIDAIDPEDGQRYRYTGSVKIVSKKDATAHNVRLQLERDPNYDLNNYAFVLDKVPSPAPAPRYGLTYDDISTREERDHWIAGSSLKVIDLQTNEVIAERIGYMVDLGQGNTSGGRSPWLLAKFNACPSFPKTPGGRPFSKDQVRDLAEKVLHIKQ